MKKAPLDFTNDSVRHVTYTIVLLVSVFYGALVADWNMYDWQSFNGMFLFQAAPGILGSVFVHLGIPALTLLVTRKKPLADRVAVFVIVWGLVTIALIVGRF